MPSPEARVHPVLDSVSEELEELERKGLLRRLTTTSLTAAPGMEVDGRPALVLCSNDYLALTRHPALSQAAAAAAASQGVGAGAARLISGTRPVHDGLEQAVRELTGRPAALTFASGFAANLSVLGALLGENDLVVSDERNHASIVDGIRLTRAQRRVVPHCDVGAVQDALRDAERFRRVVVVTEGVFSMDGDVAPLADLLTECRAVGALLIVDDAHGTGVIGDTGRGALEVQGIGDEADVVHVGTFGKAFGAAGAFVAGHADIVSLVLNRGRAFIYSTALPPPIAAAAHAGMVVAHKQPARRERCLALARLAAAELQDRGVLVCQPEAAIVSLVVGSPARALDVSQRLLQRHGVFITALRPPTVPEGTSRLRLTTPADLNKQDLLDAVHVIAEELR